MSTALDARPHEVADPPEGISPEEASQLDKPITIGLLLKFGGPIMFAFLIMNTVGIVDGIFAMRALGPLQMAATAVVNPLLMFILSVAVIFAGGGAALVVKKKGQGLHQEARRNFTLVTIVAFGISIVLSAIVLVFPEWTLDLLGANYELGDYAYRYLAIFAFAIPLMVLMQILSGFVVADGKPMLSMAMTMSNSILGLGLNALFLFGFEWGIEGIAWATVIAALFPLIIGFAVLRNRPGSTIYFVRTRFRWGVIGRVVLNGFGGAISAFSMALVIIVLNNVVVRMDGVGALGIAVAGMVIGLHSALAALVMGYQSGVGPLISFNHGTGNGERQSQLFRSNMVVLAGIAVLLVLVGSVIFSSLLVQVYVPAGDPLYEMAVHGLRIAALSFLLMGFNLFTVGHFTALNAGVVAGTLALVRLGMQLGTLVVLPRLWDLNGVWLAWPVAEALTLILTISLLAKFGGKYRYLRRAETPQLVDAVTYVS